MDDHALPVSRPAPPVSRPAPARGGYGVPLGRVFGTPVRLSPTWLLLAALVTYSYGQVVAVGRPGLPAPVAYGVAFGFVLCLVGSVLLHEVGHALTSRWFGIGVRAITLEALGGYTEMEREPPRPSVELAVSLAGPLASLLVAAVWGAAALVVPPGTVAAQLAAQLAVGNLVVAVFNALPGLPLDGGRALQAVIWAATGDPRRGRRAAAWAGRAIAGVSVVVALQLYLDGRLWLFGMAVTMLVALSIWTGAGQALRAAALAERVDGFTVARLARPIVAVAPGTSLGEALQRAQWPGAVDLVVAVADPSGQVIGLLHRQAAAAVPAERRPWITVEALTRRVEPGHVIAAGLRGVDLLRAVGDDPGADYLVVDDDDDVVGVLLGADLSTLLESEGLVSRRTTS